MSLVLGLMLAIALPTSVQANPNSSTCMKTKSSIKKLDDKNSNIWRKFDARRDAMANLNFSNTDYKGTLALLRSVLQSDLSIYNIAMKNLQCYPTSEASSIRTGYNLTVESLVSLNKIISSSNKNSDTKFNAMKETIWLWIAGEYMNYYTLDGIKV